MQTLITIINYIGYTLGISGIGCILNKAFDLNLGIRLIGAFPKDYIIAGVFFILAGALVYVSKLLEKKYPKS
jgi:hypothetical protein